MLKTGVYTKFEIHIIAPPPFLIYIFTDIYYIEGTHAAGENFMPFFVQFWNILSQLGKNMHTFHQLGKIYAFPPLFLSPLIIFFTPTCYLAKRKGRK